MSKGLFGAEDYPVVAKRAIRWMIAHSPLNIIEEKTQNLNGTGSGETGSSGTKEKMLSGVIIRHLFLPGRLEDTVMTLDWLKNHADGRSCISLMSQYTPVPFKGSSEELLRREQSLKSFENRLVNTQEDADLRDLIEAYDFDYLFYQDLSDDTTWLPDFTRRQPFSNKLAKPVWHWNYGFV